MDRLQIARRLILLTAFLSFLFSVALYFPLDRQLDGIFIAIWVPSILALASFILKKSS